MGSGSGSGGGVRPVDLCKLFLLILKEGYQHANKTADEDPRVTCTKRTVFKIKLCKVDNTFSRPHLQHGDAATGERQLNAAYNIPIAHGLLEFWDVAGGEFPGR